MSFDVIKGQKVDITKQNPGLITISVGLGWIAGTGMELDASAFLLGANGKVTKDEDLVFYGNPKGEGNSVVHINGGEQDKQTIKVNLTSIPLSTEKIAFTITIYEAQVRNQNFGQVSDVYIRITDETKNREIFRFNLGGKLSIENALVFGELYRYQGEWKFDAVGSGFSGGLTALCHNFGIEVSEITDTVPVSASTPTPTPTPRQTQINPNSDMNPKQNSINLANNLAKIELKKKGETINLQKTIGKLGEILVNLNWKQKQPSTSGGGLFSSLLGIKQKGIDLDLGCLYELKSGKIGTVQALGNAFGSLEEAPYILLDGDDRTGAVNGGENLRINGNRVSDFKRILVYTFIYAGITKWAEAEGVVTIKQVGGPDIIIALDENHLSKMMCALALIENVDDQTFSIQRLVQFYKGHASMDKAFNWGIRWSEGRKN